MQKLEVKLPLHTVRYVVLFVQAIVLMFSIWRHHVRGWLGVRDVAVQTKRLTQSAKTFTCMIYSVTSTGHTLSHAANADSSSLSSLYLHSISSNIPQSPVHTESTRSLHHVINNVTVSCD